MSSDEDVPMLDVDPIPFSGKGKGKAADSFVEHDNENLPWSVAEYVGDYFSSNMIF